MKTVKDFCDALINTFGEEHPLDAINVDKSSKYMGDYLMGEFQVTTFSISVELKRITRYGEQD